MGQVVQIVRETAQRVASAADTGEVTLVLGGDCTVGIGTVGGHVSSGERVGLIYFDSHADLNVPSSVREGALDWMGLAHMLGDREANPELVEAGPRVPLLTPEQVLLFAWDPEQATPFEREAIDRHGIERLSVDEVAADPEGAAARALRVMEGRCDRVLIHFDVDVIDFTDVPMSENWGRNAGLAYDQAMGALERLLTSPRVAALTITELNPDHVEEGADTIRRFSAAVSSGLALTVAAE